MLIRAKGGHDAGGVPAPRRPARGDALERDTRQEERDVTEQTGGRRVVTNMALSLDGHYAGRDPGDMGWVMPYAVTDVARDHMTGLWESATTALLGRVNAEGFLGFWPTVIGMEGADPRDEGFAKWLVDAEKVVLSSTLTEAPWERTTIVDRPTAQVVTELKASEGGDILVLSSASVIKALLAADQVDRLSLTIFPVFLGGGPRLFDDGLPTGRWALVSEAAGEHGTLALVYDRIR
jgi:dihydrofolate reductase